jgi:hypothetical protein
VDTDDAGNVYVGGDTISTTFPTVTPRQASPGGNGDAFVGRLSPTGAVQWMT